MVRTSKSVKAADAKKERKKSPRASAAKAAKFPGEPPAKHAKDAPAEAVKKSLRKGRSKSLAATAALRAAKPMVGITHSVAIYLYDFKDQSALPGRPVDDRDLIGPEYAPVVAMVCDVLVFYETVFDRRSYDDANGRVVIFLNFPGCGGFHEPLLEYLRFSGPNKEYENTGHIFGDFTAAADYVAHEFAHAVTCKCSELDVSHTEQSALHESLSDVFGITFRHWRAYRDDKTAKVEWRFGEGTTPINFSCTRNLADPEDVTAWEQGLSVMPKNPAGYSAYALSAVATLAFHRVAVVKGDLLGAAKIWYRALSDARMKNVKTFLDFAGLTVSVANGDEAVVRAAWASVGLVVPPPLVA